jgi:hypothetical protein
MESNQPNSNEVRTCGHKWRGWEEQLLGQLYMKMYYEMLAEISLLYEGCWN